MINVAFTKSSSNCPVYGQFTFSTQLLTLNYLLFDLPFITAKLISSQGTVFLSWPNDIDKKINIGQSSWLKCLNWLNLIQSN